MRLTKGDAILLHSVLYSFLSSTPRPEMSDDLDYDHLVDLKQSLFDFLDSEEEDSEEEQCDDDDCDDEDCDGYDDDEEEDESQSPEVDDCVTVGSLEDLPPVLVSDDAGVETDLEFEASRTSRDTIDVVFNHDVVANVPAIKLTSSAIHSWDPDQKSWRSCTLSGKVSKRWKKVIKLDKVYGITDEEDEGC